MLEMVEERKGCAAIEERQDLLSNLIRASLDKNNSRKDFEFTHRDLLGNIFVFLVVGKLLGSSTADFPIELCSRSRDDGEFLSVYYSASGNPSRRAGGAL